MDYTQPHPPLAVPHIEGGQEVYDRIMRDIEPELTSAQMPLLSKKYEGETPDAAKMRADRYAQAFAEYDRRYAQYLSEIEGQVRSFGRTVFVSTEQLTKDDDTPVMQGLESAMSAA